MKTFTKKNFQKSGFTLIELLISMLIFVMVLGGMVAVSVAAFRSYQKSRAIKTVSEDVGYALNSIAKEVRMGKVESNNASVPSNNLLVTLNRTRKRVCYTISTTSVNICDGACSNCQSMVNLSGTGMTFDGTTSGFRNQKTDVLAIPPVRGWVEINLNIENPTIETDSIHVQTVVSSRDYGWEGVP